MSAQWAVLVYIAGNSDLSDAAGADLEEMTQVGSTRDVRVLVFEKRADEHPGRLGAAYRYELGDEREDLGPTDSGDPQTLLDFLRWGFNAADAERHAVVLWNHGSGWAPWVDTVSSEVRGADKPLPAHERASLSLRPGVRAFFRPTLETTLREPTASARAILIDAGTHHSLDTVELGNVVRLAAEELGGPIDVLGMDACLMTTLEVLWQIHEHAVITVGSEETEPGTGWPYERVLSTLNANPEMSPDAVGTAIVDAYIQSYGDGDEVTQSAVRLADLPKVAEAVDRLGKTLQRTLPSGADAIGGARDEAVVFDGNLVDLRTFALGLLDRFDGEAKSAADGVLALLKVGAGPVTAEAHLGDGVQGCGGVSAYLPRRRDPISPYYANTEFASQFSWDAFLHAYNSSGLRHDGPT